MGFLRARKAIAALILTVLCAEPFGVYKRIAFADESLTAFQQEIIVAKQKQQALAGKVQTARISLDKERARLLNTEAQTLLDEISKRESQGNEAKSHPRPDLKAVVEDKNVPWTWDPAMQSVLIGDKPMRAIRLAPKVPVRLTSTEKEKRESLKKAKEWFIRRVGYKEKKPTPAEMVYKVAVSDGKITLEEAIEIAEAGSVQLKALREKAEAARAKVTEAKRALFPTAQGVLEFNRGLAGQISTSDPHGRYFKGERRKLNITQPLYYGGELVLTVKQAEANVRITEEEYNKARSDLVYQVKTAYYGVVKSEYNMQYQAELFAEVSDFRKKAREGRDRKVVAELEYLAAESQYQQALFQVEAARNDLATAALLLQQTTDLPGESNLPIDLRLNFAKTEVNLEEIVEVAMRNNPDVRGKTVAVESAQYGVEIFKAKKKPRIDLKGSVGLITEVHKDTQALEEDNHDLDLEKEWFLGVQGSMPFGPNTLEVSQQKNVYGPTIISLTGSEERTTKFAFNLFDRFSDITDEKSAQAALSQAQAELDKSKDELSSKIREDYYTVQKSAIQIDSAVSKMRFQERQNEIQRYLMGIGEGNLETLLEGLVEQAQNRFSFIQAVADYNLAVAGLNHSIGDPEYLGSEA